MNTVLVIVIVLLGLVALLLALSLLASYLMTRNAIDRIPPRLPEGLQRVFQGRGGRRRPANGGPSPRALRAQALRETEMERVEITAWDGVSLVGHLRRAEQPRRVVLCFHGWHSTWADDFSGPGEPLHAMGCTALFCEMRGGGESGGRYMCYGTRERYDVLDWVRWAREAFGPEVPLYVFGVSFGATCALLAAGSGMGPEINGVIADSGFLSAKDICYYIVGQNMHLAAGFFYPQVNFFCQRLAHFTCEEANTLEALAENTRPVLFLHGGADTFVPPEMTERNYAACRAPKEKLIFPGAGHIRSWYTDPARYEAALSGFFEKWD